MKIRPEVVEKLMRERNLKPEDMRKVCGFKSVEGFNKILREASTKEKTARAIADKLLVHISVISGEKMRFQKSVFTVSEDERELAVIKGIVDKHEREISELKTQYTKLLEKLQGLS